MVLDEQAKKQLIERLKAGRAKKKAEKEAAAPAPAPKAPKLKPQPKPRKVEYKDLTKVVEEEPLESDVDIVELVPEPKVDVPVTKVSVPEPEPEPVKVAEPPVVKPKEAIAKTKKDDKDRFMKVVFYKEPSKRQLRLIDTIDDSSSDEEPEPAKPPKIVKKAVAKIPKTPRVIEPTAEEKRYKYLKQLADEFF